MTFTPTSLRGSFLIEPKVFQDERGWFARYYCKDDFKEIGHNREWVQLNQSVTENKGTVRGLHFQMKPFREIKMVKCIMGAIFDVILDLRLDSPTFLNWFGAELSAKNKKMLYIPEGFAHGFQSLEDNCELIYHHTEFYTPNFESGIRYDDPKIKIQWPLPVTMLSPRDKSHPYLDESFKGV
jgi:dTDP-4-dehydrorhamnose 3,5-epimerase